MYARRLLRGQNTMYTNQRPEKYISSLISLQWDFNLLVCLQKFSFAIHKSLQLLLLKFRRKSCQCVADACIFDNPLSKKGSLSRIGYLMNLNAVLTHSRKIEKT